MTNIEFFNISLAYYSFILLSIYTFLTIYNLTLETESYKFESYVSIQTKLV